MSHNSIPWLYQTANMHVVTLLRATPTQIECTICTANHNWQKTFEAKDQKPCQTTALYNTRETSTVRVVCHCC